MDYSNVTDNQQVIKLLIQRRSIENQIMKIDSRALINYELERLAEPQANGIPTSDEALPIGDVGGALLLEAKECLVELCQLKAYKDDVGKDEVYQKAWAEAWKRANDVLNRIVKNQ